MRVIPLVVGALALGVAVSAQSREAGEAGIRVFDDVTFQGATRSFSRDVPDLREFGLNDRVSSLQVAPGESWEVCEDTNYRGRCVVVSGSDHDLGLHGWNDFISSMRRVPGRRGFGGGDDRDDRGRVAIRVYEDVNFQGAPASFRGDVSDLRDFGLSDQISSLQVAQGESWEVCEDVNYGGRCAVVSGSERDLRTSGWNDLITSMRRVPTRSDRDDRFDRGRAIDGPRLPRGEIVLFDELGYRGAAQNVTEAAAGLGALANHAQSAQILDGDWELCEEPRWSGRCVRISSSVPDLRRLGLSRVASARPLDLPR